MIIVQRYCRCGERLDKKAVDEEQARALLSEFLSQHVGREYDGTLHEPMRRAPYWRMIRKAQAELRASAEAEAKRLQAQMIANAPRTKRYTVKRKGV